MIVVGWILVGAGAILTAAFISDMIFNSTDIGASIAAMLMFGNAPFIAGAVLVRVGRSRLRQRRIDLVEKQLLAIARQNRGNLTATLVAMETPLSIDEARSILELFVTRGVADMVVDDNGAVIYHFRELLVDNS